MDCLKKVLLAVLAVTGALLLCVALGYGLAFVSFYWGVPGAAGLIWLALVVPAVLGVAYHCRKRGGAA